MYVRITGDEKEREEILNILREKKEIYSVSHPYKYESNDKWKSIYIEILSPEQIIVSNIRDHQILEYCRQWRSKNDVCKFFKMKFEEAEEILERLYRHGDLDRELNDSGSRRHHHYEYKTIEPQQVVLFADGRYEPEDDSYTPSVVSVEYLNEYPYVREDEE